MKTLILVRHASAEPRENGQHDMERPLSKKGRRTAKQIGKAMKGHANLPQKVYASFARRARQTAKRVIKQLDHQAEITLREDLYLAEPQAFVDILHEVPDELDCVMLVGHNPGIREFLQMLTDNMLRFPKSAVAYISLPYDSWQQVSLASRGELDTLLSLHD